MAVQKKTADHTAEKATKKLGAKKSVAKKSVAKSSAKKAKPVKKTTVKPSTKKKTVAKRTTAKTKGKTTSELLKAIKARDIETNKNKTASKKKSANTKTTAKKRAVTKTIPESNPLPIVPPMQKAIEIVASSAKPKTRRRRAKFNKKDLDKFMTELMTMRDHFIEQTGTMKNYALQRDDGANTEEDGTDSFMRLQALTQVKSQQKVISDIAIALEAINNGTYGTCEMCECLISKPRLKARPFAKYCINCKSEIERGMRHKK